MKRVILILVLLTNLALESSAQKTFSLTISNSKNAFPVGVKIERFKQDNTLVSKDSFRIEQQQQIPRNLKLRPNEFAHITGFTSNGKEIKDLHRTYAELNEATVGGSTASPELNPKNVNLIEIQRLHDVLDFGQLVNEISNNQAIKNLLDPNLKIDKNILLGSFIIYDSTKKQILEVYPPTTKWNTGKEARQLFGKYEETITKTAKKSSVNGLNGAVKDFIQAGASSATSDVFDFKWSVYGFKEETFGIGSEGPQSIFKNYKDDTGFKTLKRLIKQDKAKANNYQVLFISTWAITDSIKTFVSSFVDFDRKLEFDLRYPPVGQKVFNIGGQFHTKGETSYLSAQRRQNIYNYFKFSDISLSSIGEIMDEIDQEEAAQSAQFEQIRLDNQRTRLKELADEIVKSYNVVKTIENDEINKSDDISIVLVTPLFKRTVNENIPADLTEEQKKQILTNNRNSLILNNLIESIEEKSIEYKELKQSLDNWVVVSQNQIKVKTKITTSTTVRNPTTSELKALLSYNSSN